MALASDIMKAGVSAVAAKAMQGQVASAVAAAGTTISDATDLKMSVNVVTSGTGGVHMPDAEIGDEIDVCNLTSAAITVYPPTGSRINGLSASAGFLLGANTSCKLKKFTATRWLGNLSA